jgi:hypothetical protein
MRKFILAVVLAALGTALLATSASAFDSHFSVVAKQKSSHRVGHKGFRFREVLLEPHNRSERVGRDRVTCRAKSRHHVKCHAVVHLNGEIGGRGDIKVVGDIGSGDNRLNVFGGTKQFNGVAGKVLVQRVNSKVNKLHFHLVR